MSAHAAAPKEPLRLETREVLAACYLGPNKGRTMLTHSVEVGASGMVIRAICDRVSPLSLADKFAQDTTLEPTCLICRARKRKWKVRESARRKPEGMSPESEHLSKELFIRKQLLGDTPDPKHPPTAEMARLLRQRAEAAEATIATLRELVERTRWVSVLCLACGARYKQCAECREGSVYNGESYRKGQTDAQCGGHETKACSSSCSIGAALAAPAAVTPAKEDDA